jgi:hypothetical protein
MRRILGIAAILTGFASASASETSYKACAINGRIGFFSFNEVGDFVEIKVVGSAEEPFSRPANLPLLIELDGEVLVFGDKEATLLKGEEVTQLDCYWMNANQVAAFDSEAAFLAAELERQVQLLNEQVVDLRRRLAAVDVDRVADLEERLAKALDENVTLAVHIALLRSAIPKSN